MNQSFIEDETFKGVNFKESPLEKATYESCTFNNFDFLNAKFDNTILEKADLRSSFNYTINSENNRLKGAKFSLKEVVGLLSQYQIKIG